MTGKFVGPCIAIIFDKRGTPILVIEDTANSSSCPQTARCWDKAIATTARNIQRGDIITVEWKMEAKYWTPKDGSPATWLPSSINATKIQVGAPASQKPEDNGDDEPPF